MYSYCWSEKKKVRDTNTQRRHNSQLRNEKSADFPIIRDNQRSRSGPRGSGLRLNKPENLGTSDYRITCVIAILPSREIGQLPTTARRAPIIPVMSLFHSYARRRDRIPGYEEARWRFRSVASDRDDTETASRKSGRGQGEKRAGNYFQSRCDWMSRCDGTVRRWRTVAGRETVSGNFFVPLSRWHWMARYDFTWSEIISGGKQEIRDWPGNVTSWRNIPVFFSFFVSSVASSVSSWNGETSCRIP